MIEPEDKDLVVSDDPFPFSLGDMGDFGDIFQGFDDDAFLAFLKDHPQSTYELWFLLYLFFSPFSPDVEFMVKNKKFLLVYLLSYPKIEMGS